MYKKSLCCKHCQLNFDGLSNSERANHSRWCNKNPKRVDYVKSNNGSQLNTVASIEKRNKGIKQAHIDGKYVDAPKKALSTKRSNGSLNHSDKTKDILRQKALASPHRRLIRSIREYTKKDGSVVKLDSSWEEALAKRLDDINIEWTRPTPIKWIDKDGSTHNYFPDFYLPAYDLYLDPKNPYAIKAQLPKIICLKKQVPNLRFIETLDECIKFIP